MLAGPSHQEQAISAWALVTSECQKARAGCDRELVTERGDVPDGVPVVAGVSEEQDDSPGSEVALLGAEATNDGLHVV